MTEPAYDVFFSYNTADRSAVEELAHALRDRSVNVFLDRWHMLPGSPWQEQFEVALSASRTVLLFIGREGLGPWENLEVRVALSRLVDDPSFRVIPVLGPGADPEHIPT